MKEFKETTIVTIAHRLDTVIFYDRIFVFESGELVERGSPYDLLRMEGKFKNMVEDNGLDFYKKMKDLT